MYFCSNLSTGGESMDIFTWKTQLQDTIEMSYGQNVREVNFGDGYTQVAGLGINIHNEKWALTLI